MANVHPEGHDSPNLDLGSHCSSMPSVNATDLDEEIMPRAEFLELKPNNHVYETEVRIRHPIVAEILKGHPLWTALNDSVQVPHIYVQQFWKHLEFHPDEGDHHFMSKIDHFDTSFDISKLRRLLRLPKNTDRPDRQDYDVLVNESQLLQDIRSLGYAQELPRLSDFLKKFLPPIYYTLFSILNRCLTGKNSGIDSGSISMLTLFHGVVFDRHYDYAQLIFNEIEEAVAAKFKGKKDRRYLPFQRYLQILVKSAMRRNLDIPRREQYQLGPVSHMQFVRYNDEQFQFERPLLPEVVAYADQTVPCVQEYIRTHALMVRPRPVGPAHGVNPSGVGIDVSRGLEHGVQDRGEQRENVIERGICVGGTVNGFAVADVHTDNFTTVEAGPSEIHFE